MRLERGTAPGVLVFRRENKLRVLAIPADGTIHALGEGRQRPCRLLYTAINRLSAHADSFKIEIRAILSSMAGCSHGRYRYNREQVTTAFSEKRSCDHSF